MTGREFRHARRQRGWTQGNVAARLGISQTYMSLLEHDQRHFPPGLVRKAVTLLRMSPSALSLSPHSSSNTELTRQLSALGYPGFAHVRPARRRNPAEVLLAALGKDNLEARVAEALPWLLLQYGAMGEECEKRMVEEGRLRGLTNRLAFPVTRAEQAAKRECETNSRVYRAPTR